MHINDMSYNPNFNIMNNVNMQENNADVNNATVSNVKAVISEELLNLLEGGNGSNVSTATKDATIYKILDANGLLATEKNYNIADTLLKNNLPVDKTSMQKVIQQAYKFGENEIDTIVSLNRMGIKVNDENIAQYKDYVNNTHQLTNNIKEFSEIVIKAYNNELSSINPSESGIKELLSVNAKIIDAIYGDISGTQMVSAENELMGNQMASAENKLFGNQEVSAENELMGNQIVSAENKLFGNQEVSAENKLMGNQEVSVKNELPKNQEVSAGKGALNNLIEDMKSAGIDEDKIKQVIDGADSNSNLVSNIQSILSDDDSLDFSKIKDFLKGEAFADILKQAISEKMTLNPDKMKNPSEINEVYKGIYEKTNKLLNAFSNNDNQFSQQLEQQAKGMSERLDFINALNNMYTYAQIPLNMNSRELNSELFVYMNKKGIKQNKEAVSALLHLDMEHLGATDVHVSLHGGTVHTRFYVDDEESAKIIDEHMNMLEKAINESGYQLTNEVINREISIDNKKSNAVVDELLDNDLEKSVKCYSFDARM